MPIQLADSIATEPKPPPNWLDHAGAIDLRSLLERLVSAGKAHDEVSFGDLVKVSGRRSFAPFLLTASILGFTPLGVVPGVPTTLATIIVLVAGQIALGFRSLWLPDFLRHRKVKGRRLAAAAATLNPAARVIDSLIRPRLACLTEGVFSRLIAVACVMLSLAVPPLEFVPLVDIPLWAVITAFSLALATHDGVLALAALLLTPVSIYLVSGRLF